MLATKYKIKYEYLPALPRVFTMHSWKYSIHRTKACIMQILHWPVIWMNRPMDLFLHPWNAKQNDPHGPCHSSPNALLIDHSPLVALTSLFCSCYFFLCCPQFIICLGDSSGDWQKFKLGKTHSLDVKEPSIRFQVHRSKLRGFGA